MIDDLRFKLNPSLQNALLNVPDPIDIYNFAAPVNGSTSD
jgi:hypothetical protein